MKYVSGRIEATRLLCLLLMNPLCRMQVAQQETEIVCVTGGCQHILMMPAL